MNIFTNLFGVAAVAAREPTFYESVSSNMEEMFSSQGAVVATGLAATSAAFALLRNGSTALRRLTVGTACAIGSAAVANSIDTGEVTPAHLMLLAGAAATCVAAKLIPVKQTVPSAAVPHFQQPVTVPEIEQEAIAPEVVFEGGEAEYRESLGNFALLGTDLTSEIIGLVGPNTAQVSKVFNILSKDAPYDSKYLVLALEKKDYKQLLKLAKNSHIDYGLHIDHGVNFICILIAIHSHMARITLRPSEIETQDKRDLKLLIESAFYMLKYMNLNVITVSDIVNYFFILFNRMSAHTTLHKRYGAE